MLLPIEAKQAASSNPSINPMSEQSSKTNQSQHVPAPSLRRALRHDTIVGNILEAQSSGQALV